MNCLESSRGQLAFVVSTSQALKSVSVKPVLVNLEDSFKMQVNI